MTDWFCRIYRVLLYAYPPGFRRRYGKEMAQVFCDRCRGIAQKQGNAGLLRFGMHCGMDWLATALREGIASVRESTPSPGASRPAFDGVPVFYTVGSSSPPPAALIPGGGLTIVIFAILSFVLGHSGSHRLPLIGSHHPSRSHLLGAQTEAAPKEPQTEVKANPYPDEVPIHPYLRLILVLGALDTDHDNVISAVEIASAADILKKLDKNHDGKLDAEECGARFGDDTRGDPQLLKRARIAFMRFHPALAALDADHDGAISASEIKCAAAALVTLDKNNDGKLTLDELLPQPVKR